MTVCICSQCGRARVRIPFQSNYFSVQAFFSMKLTNLPHFITKREIHLKSEYVKNHTFEQRKKDSISE